MQHYYLLFIALFFIACANDPAPQPQDIEPILPFAHNDTTVINNRNDNNEPSNQEVIQSEQGMGFSQTFHFSSAEQKDSFSIMANGERLSEGMIRFSITQYGSGKELYRHEMPAEQFFMEEKIARVDKTTGESPKWSVEEKDAMIQEYLSNFLTTESFTASAYDALDTENGILSEEDKTTLKTNANLPAFTFSRGGTSKLTIAYLPSKQSAVVINF